MNATTISTTINSSDRRFVVASATGFAVDKLVKVDQEIMKITKVSGTLISVFRGLHATEAVSHMTGAAAYCGTPNEFPPSNAGTAAAGVTAHEERDGAFHITTLRFTNLSVGTVADNAAKAFGVLIYTLPVGAKIINGSSVSVGLTGSNAGNAADTPELGLGTVIATGSEATLGAAGATMENIMEGAAVTNCTGTAYSNIVGTDLGILASGAKTIHLNVADTWADITGAGTITATGTVKLSWYDM